MPAALFAVISMASFALIAAAVAVAFALITVATLPTFAAFAAFARSLVAAVRASISAAFPLAIVTNVEALCLPSCRLDRSGSGSCRRCGVAPTRRRWSTLRARGELLVEAPIDPADLNASSSGELPVRA